MTIFGYHRTSTAEQNLERGIFEIESFCKSQNLQLEKIYTDQVTGKNFNRARYIVLKEDVLRPGDVLIISEIDRLGRNKRDTLAELRYFKDNNIRVMILEIPTTLADYSTMDNNLAKMILETINNMLIEMYAAFAEAEIEKKEKRQREGIQAKKARGDWENYGRPPAIAMSDFVFAYKDVQSGKIRPVDCMKQLELTKATYYRYRSLVSNSLNDSNTNALKD